jgi:hypothetical protein
MQDAHKEPVYGATAVDNTHTRTSGPVLISPVEQGDSEITSFGGDGGLRVTNPDAEVEDDDSMIYTPELGVQLPNKLPARSVLGSFRRPLSLISRWKL